MVIIPEGDFIMGTYDADIKNIAPRHKVYLDTYYMDKFEVTNSQFASFLNSVKPSSDVRLKWVLIRSDLFNKGMENFWPTEIMYENGAYSAFEGFEDYPVLAVNFDAADAYCEWAEEDLPTEAQWEKAARGGLSDMRYPWGNEIPTKGIIFNKKWQNNADPPPTEKVGNYIPNGYGVFDMAGNVWEWCSDWYAPNYYAKSPKSNPPGSLVGLGKVLRGGSWYNNESALRVAFRNYMHPLSNNEDTGFRCVKNIKND